MTHMPINHCTCGIVPAAAAAAAIAAMHTCTRHNAGVSELRWSLAIWSTVHSHSAAAAAKPLDH